MIYINGKSVKNKRFPDGTSAARFRPETRDFDIVWFFDGDEECMLLWNLVHHIRSHVPSAQIVLRMLYLPNARMDRVKNRDEIFTLKWFAEFINHLNFLFVEIHDPHSNVGVALIDRATVVGVTDHISDVLAQLGKDTDNLIFCYPDEGATKKYSEQLEMEYVFGIKHRDWRTGKIQGLELNNAEAVNGKNVLIVDDICSKGGTFIHTAKALKEAGAEKVFLWVTHCEDTIHEGEVLTSDLIDRVFTTQSIYRGPGHAKITLL